MTDRQLLIKTALILLFLALPCYAFSATSLGTFSNYSGITINDNSAATPYPSSIIVSGVTSSVAKIRVTLHGITHGSPPEIGILLAGPMGQSLVLMDEAGGAYDALNNDVIIFDDSGIQIPPSKIVSGTYYKPTNQTRSYFPTPAPSEPYYSTPLNETFSNISPNGTWNLYVRDAGQGDAGAITGGWELEFFTLQDAPFFTLTGAPGSIVSGSPFNLTVSAKNANGTTNTSFTGTVSFSSTAASTILPADYTFSPADNGSHTFSGAVLNTIGTQTITVTGSEGMTGTSSEITVVPPTPATIMPAGQPENTTIISGQMATLKVTATGTGTLSYQWYQGLSPDTSSPIPGAIGSSYTTPPLYGPASYWVQVTGTYGYTVTTADSNTAHIFTVNKPAFSNSTRITINDIAAATPYPSSLVVSGVTGTVGKVRVTLSGMYHDSSRDVGVLLVGPSGQSVVLMDGAGGEVDTIDANTNIIFDDDGTPLSGTKIVSGTYKPTNLNGSDFPAQAPKGPYSASLSTFNGIDPNGIWQLYVRDSATGGGGAIEGGWDIEFQIPTHAFTVNIDGSGSGTVTSSPQVSGSISCQKGSNAHCSASFPTSEPVSLYFSKSSGSIFSGWSQDCNGTGACGFTTMESNRSVTATFDSTPPFFLYSASPTPGNYMSSLQGAYDTAPDNAVIQMQVTIPAGGFTAAPAQFKTVSIRGGYDADFTPNPVDTAFTTIRGKVAVRHGKLKVQGVKVR